MARIPYPDTPDQASKTATAYASLPGVNLRRILGYSEHLMGPMMEFGRVFLNEGKLDPALREIVILRVAHVCGSTYEARIHEAIAKEVGVTPDVIAAIKTTPDNPAFTPLETLVLRYTDELQREFRAGDDLFEALSDQFSPAQMQELTLLAAYYQMLARFLETFEVDLEDYKPK